MTEGEIKKENKGFNGNIIKDKLRVINFNEYFDKVAEKFNREDIEKFSLMERNCKNFTYKFII